ncbi:type II toxin-antitoxin system Phd/YefM family antitoxin [Limnobacter sp.]|uniref:type II toxin-antitoxin system Phd/YefM family antitoxin n=1 Tax=Limnobacter sp. TaxID=2003368 RepID=UPI00351236FE
MQTYNIHEAKTQLSKLVEMAAKGESFVIAKAGKPMVKVTALDTPESSQMKRFGFMAGEIKVPEDFNTMGADEIQHLFEGQE